MAINASIIVCDDIRQENNGKLFIIGFYTGNIILPAEEWLVMKLIFFFTLDCPNILRPKSITFEITLPNDEPQVETVPLAVLEPEPHHTRWIFRHPLLVQGKTLRPGKIKGRVLLDEQELEVSTPWIVVPPPPDQTLVDPIESANA